MLKILRSFCAQRTFIRNYAKKLEETEMKYLNVAEKNDAAKTIAGLLSNGSAQRREGYSVYNKIYDFDGVVNGRNCKMVMTSVSGHLLTLEFLTSYRNWRNVDPQTLFDAPIRKTCSENYQPIKRTLEREIRGCQGLIIWTDCDREGENIGLEIVDVCRAIKPNITVHRAIFSEITARAVRRALQQLTIPDKRQSDAVDVRSELDLRTGAAITRFQTMRLQRLFPEKIADKLISYGSCQIPTLGFVAERYKEIEAFVSEPFWKIKVSHTIDDLTVEFNWARNRLFDKQTCEDYLLLCLADPRATVESVTVKPKNKWRPVPLDTVELEKLGSRKLKLSAKETMTIAEKLYTQGIISYPRTETNQFSKEINLSSLVEQQTGHSDWGSFALRVKEWGPNPRNGNKSDQAHPPIHPTKMVTNLQGNEGRVYELICRHFLACVSKDATGSETVVNINIAGEKFTATGLCIYERNYLDVYIYEKWNAKQIHRYEEGQIFEPTDISLHEGATTAPPLLTEADLIALMEKHGIGTDATHAEHINTIKERGYIGVVDKGCLVPGVIGMGLYEGYDAMQLALAKPVLRAEFEADLKKICLGEKDPKIVLSEHIRKYKEAYKQIMEKITAMDEKMAQRVNETPANNPNNDGNGNTENNPNRVQEISRCPKCSVAFLALKQKKNQTGYFIGCMNFPDCKNVVWLPNECKELSVLDEHCENCGSDVKLIKLKFQTAYYKSMFNAPFGWYKTCLRCDSQFRECFNINVDCVKPVGPIVGDATSHAQARPTTSGATTTQGTNNRSAPGPSSAPGTQSNAKKNNEKQQKTSTETLARPKTTTSTNITRPNLTRSKTSTDIRSFFTNCSNSQSTSTTQSTTRSMSTEAAAELEGISLEDLFDSNDGFEDIAIGLDSNVASSTTSMGRTDNNTNQTTPITSNTTLNASIAAAFADDDFDDFNWGSNSTPHMENMNLTNDFEDFSWGTTGSIGNPRIPSHSNEQDSRQERYTRGVSSRCYKPAPISQIQNDDSLSAFYIRDDDLENYSWGTAERNQRSEPNQTIKRPRLENAQANGATTRQQDDYVWGAAAHAEAIKCTGCHQVAKELTVRKDGPNKGRTFYVCPKSKACKFFQWADELPQSNNNEQPQTSRSAPAPASATFEPTTSTGWGTSRNSTTSTVTIPDNTEAINCSCGLPASSLPVRKDGPNKGRPFFACPNRDKSCGFFKWGDDSEASTSAAVQNLNNNWGTSNRPSTSAASSSNVQREPKKRKCGLCRQEGHTKQKCPRKDEFNY